MKFQNLILNKSQKQYIIHFSDFKLQKEVFENRWMILVNQVSLPGNFLILSK